MTKSKFTFATRTDSVFQLYEHALQEMNIDYFLEEENALKAIKGHSFGIYVNFQGDTSAFVFQVAKDETFSVMHYDPNNTIYLMCSLTVSDHGYSSRYDTNVKSILSYCYEFDKFEHFLKLIKLFQSCGVIVNSWNKEDDEESLYHANFNHIE